MPSAALRVIHREGGAERVELDPERPFVIGRGSESSYVLDRPGVDRRHVELLFFEGAWWIRGGVGTTSGTWLEGRFVLESRRLIDGDVIQLGEVDDVLFRFESSGTSIPAAPRRFDQRLVVSPDAAAARGLPRVGLELARPEGLMPMPGADDRTWLTLSSPPGGGPFARFVRGPRLDDAAGAPRRLVASVAPREEPTEIASGRVLALAGIHPAIAWVYGESLGRMATIAIAVPHERMPGEAIVLAFSLRSPGALEPWIVLSHAALAPLLAARLV
ncbi:MAG: FHA domain-containing protein [Sandaracinaceae bacterium]|nr:FHA domain-containing protein [Sandaracinaceae bacterium]